MPGDDLVARLTFEQLREMVARELEVTLASATCEARYVVCKEPRTVAECGKPAVTWTNGVAMCAACDEQRRRWRGVEGRR